MRGTVNLFPLFLNVAVLNYSTGIELQLLQVYLKISRLMEKGVLAITCTFCYSAEHFSSNARSNLATYRLPFLSLHPGAPPVVK
jgi:hypothetical protein